MLAQYLDLTNEFNHESGVGYVEFEVSNYDYAIVQLEGLDEPALIKATIDSGAIQSVTDGNVLTSDNYFPIYVTSIYDGIVQIGDTGLGDGLYRIDIVGRYIKISSATNLSASGKLLVMLAKIS